jgi:hypothetical protein
MSERDTEPSQEYYDDQLGRIPEIIDERMGRVLDRDAPIAEAYRSLGHGTLTTAELAERLGVTEQLAELQRQREQQGE